MKVVIWARVSSREQREGYSLDAQIRANRERAEKQGWTVAREFVVAESAKRGAERLAFNEMFRWVKTHAKKEKIQAILAHKLDRVCRNMRDAVRLQELEDLCGVKLAFVENQFGPGAAGALSFNVMAAVAQYYSDNLRSEVLKGMDEKIRQGWPAGHAPFGYLNVPDKDEPVVPHPENSKTLVRIFELFASGHYTLESLADKLLADGHVYSPSRAKFSRNGLSFFLSNRFYIGELSRNGSVHRGRYKIVIDPVLFDRCQDILNGRNRRTGKSDIMLSGCVLRCGCCGYGVTGELKRKRLKGGGHNVHVYYGCGNNYKPKDHPRVRWTEEKVEEAILQDLESMRIPDPDMAEWVREGIEHAMGDQTRLRVQQRASLAKRKTELTSMQDRLLSAFLTGTIEEGAFNAKSAELKREAENVARRLEDVAQVDPEAGELALSVFDFSQNLADLWRGSKFAERRELLECVTWNRTLNDASLCLEKRSPFDYMAKRGFLKDGRGAGI